MAGRLRRKRRSQRRPELSQHFIKRASTAKQLVDLASIGRKHLVIEAGPGDGALTAPLAEVAERVIAIEADRTLYSRLSERLASAENVTIRHGDFLRQKLPAGKYVFFANIPYARTADIVKKLTLGPAPPEKAFVIIQAVAAKRFLGQPFGPESALSMMIKARFRLSVAAWLGPQEFSPPPRVNSVMLALERTPVFGSDYARLAQFDRFVREVFRASHPSSQNTVRRALPRPQAQSLVADLGFPLSVPPSEVSFDHWMTVFNLSRHTVNGTNAPGSTF